MSGPQQVLFAKGAAGGGGTDPFFSSVVQLAHFDGSTGSTTLTNSCSRGNTLTVNGTGAISELQSVFGGASYRVQNATSYATAAAHTDYAFGTSDWTIEMAFRPDSVGVNGIIDMRNGSASDPMALIYTLSDGTIIYFASGSDRITSSTGVITTATWKRVAAARVSGTTRLFVDGVQVGSNFTDSINYGNGVTPIIVVGGTYTGANTQLGYFDELRLTNGVGRYSANYTPAVAAFPNS